MARKRQGENLHRRKKKKSGGKTAVLAVVLIVVLVAALALVGAMVVGKTSTIHPNMVIGGVDIGGMTVSEAEKALTAAGWETQGDAEVSVTLPGDYKITVTSEEAGLKTSSREAAEAAYAYGHSGNILNDLKAYFRCITGKATAADVLSSANAEGIRAKVEAALTEYDAFLKQGYRVDIEKAKLELVKGGESVRVDADELCGLIVKAFEVKATTVDYTATVDAAESVDFKKIHDELYTEAVEAKYDAETKKVTESAVGVDFDVEKAQKLWDAAEPGDTVTVPLEITKPKYTSEQLNKMLFHDKLGAQTTVYRSSAEGRATNVELSAAKINGVVLNPGEVFSYNDVVGKRTAEAGFKLAGAYAGGKVVQEIGGGICQTSSTLYCAALFANLEITQRDCHMFAVGYVPWGMDATVSWGGPEFKFKNNREFPIKIVAKTENRELTIEIWGTDVDGSYVEMTNSVSTVYDKKYPKVAVGTRAVTYRNVYDKDGNLLSRTKEDVSVYNYHPEDIKWPSPSPLATPKPTAKPTAKPTSQPTAQPTHTPAATVTPTDTLAP